MSNVNVGLIITGNSADARRELDRTQREVNELKRGNEQLGRASENYGRRAVQSNQQVARSTRDLGRQTSQLKGIVAGLGAAYLAMRGIRAAASLAVSFKDAASEAEGFRVRLNTLLGSVYEGNRAFDEMAEFAGTVPFEYREIMAAATDLSGVLEGGVDDISTYMPIIADLAAVSGLSIQETTSQVIRMYSAGAASADMFRERGVLAMLGFQAGVSYSAEETRRTLIRAWEDPASKFRGATEDLAKNWTGIMSMMSDSWFQFRDSFMEDTVLWDFLKTALDEFRMWWADVLNWSQSEFDAWANGVIATLKVVGVGFTTLWDVALAPKRVFTALQAVGETISEWIIYPLNLAGMVSDETYKKYVEGAEAARNRVEWLNQTTSDFLVKMDEIERKARTAFQMRELNASIEEAIATNEELFGSQKRVTEAVQDTGTEGAKAMGDLDGAIDKLIQNQELFAADWKQSLQDRLTSTEQSLRTELEALEANRREQLKIIEAAERAGLDSTMTYAEMRRRVDEQYMEERTRLEQQGADQMEQIWENAVENMQREFADTIYNALWEDGISSFEDFGDALLDIWKRTIAEMVSAWLTSGIAGMLADEGFGGFSMSLGSSSGGNAASTVANMGINKAISAGFDKIAASEFGQSIASALDKIAASEFGQSIASALGFGQSAGISGASVTGGAAGAGLGGAAVSGGISGASVTGGAAGAGLGGGSAAAGGTAAAGSAASVAAAAVPLAIAAFGMHQMSIQKPHDIAMRNFELGLGEPAGALGLQITQDRGLMFAGGANAGFAAEYAKDQGFEGTGLRGTRPDQELGQFGTASVEEVKKIIAEAAQEFEALKKTGAEMFDELGVSATGMGDMLRDGVTDEAERARIKMSDIGTAIEDPKTGMMELGDISSAQMGRLMRAVEDGDVRLHALQNTALLTGQELKVLGDIGLDAMIQTANGAWELASAINAIPSEKTITIHEYHVSSTVEPGGSGSLPGLAEGGVVTRRGLYELSEYNHPEVVIPLSRGRSVPVEMRGGGGGASNGEQLALLRSIDGRLERLDRLERAVVSSGQHVREGVDKTTRETRKNRRNVGQMRAEAA